MPWSGTFSRDACATWGRNAKFACAPKWASQRPTTHLQYPGPIHREASLTELWTRSAKTTGSEKVPNLPHSRAQQSNMPQRRRSVKRLQNSTLFKDTASLGGTTAPHWHEHTTALNGTPCLKKWLIGWRRINSVRYRLVRVQKVNNIEAEALHNRNCFSH
jgi:hypothetical protein